MNTPQTYGANDASSTIVEPMAPQADCQAIHPFPLSAYEGKPYGYEYAFSLKVTTVCRFPENSRAEVLLWAITQYRTDKLDELITFVNENDQARAGAMLHEIGLCDEMLIELTLGLHEVAVRNAELIQLLERPDRAAPAAEVKAANEAQSAHTIKRILKRL